MPHAAEDVRRVALDLHAAAAAIALLATPQFAVHEFQVDRQTRGHAGEQRHQRLSVGLTGCRKSEHEENSIVADAVPPLAPGASPYLADTFGARAPQAIKRISLLALAADNGILGWT